MTKTVLRDDPSHTDDLRLAGNDCHIVEIRGYSIRRTARLFSVLAWLSTALMVSGTVIRADVASFEGKHAGEERESNGLKLKLCWCPPGRFTMGSPSDEVGRYDNENEVQVTFTRGFWMGKFEVTQGQWQTVMKAVNGGLIGGEGAQLPICRVSHDESKVFCEQLSDIERRAGGLSKGWEYRLPSEAQWEYACRAGTTTATAFGDNLSSTLANFNGGLSMPYLKRTVAVGSYKPNNWGLCDMHGNAWEWCADWYVKQHPGGRDPIVTESAGATMRVLRGGGWNDYGRSCRSASRGHQVPSFKRVVAGLRVAVVESR